MLWHPYNVADNINMQLDSIDREILSILQADGRTSNVDLAQHIGLTPGPTLARVHKLESAGYIQRYVAIVDRQGLGLPVTAFVSVILHSHNKEASEDFVRAASEMDEVLEVHHIAGEEDFLLKVVAQDPTDYERFVLDKLTSVPVVCRVKTIFVLSSPKCTTMVPVRIGETS